MASTGEVHVGDGAEPPVVNGVPILGTAPWLKRNRGKFFERCAARYDGGVVGYRIFSLYFYLLTDPDAVADVYGSQSENLTKSQHGLAEMIPHGLLTTRGEEWERHRRTLDPAFSPSQIPEYVDEVNAAVDEHVGEWSDGETVDVEEWCRSLTLTVSLNTILDVDVERRYGEIETALRRLPDGFDSRKWSVALSELLPFTVPAARRSERAVAELRSIAGEIVDERRDGDEDHDDVLSMLMSAEFDDGEAVTRAELEDEVINFLFTGSETTRLAFTYVLFTLANNPECQSKVQAELDAVLDGQPRVTEFGDVGELEYLDKVIRESLRLYPPVSAMNRVSDGDVSIGGYEFPPETIFTLSPWLLHRDERFFDDPEQFRPERWTDEADSERHRYAYLPFGAGRRHCIGKQFGKMIIKLGVAAALRRYTLEPVTTPPLDLILRITLQPSDGVRVVTREREHA